ncbi:EI24 domain-containing protein [Caenimonas koreensis]|uniref:EI24 domain-containing protein n=1 Tax=Caenimonas koreensis TaxID=367474 RepID=UPI003784A2B4
MSLFLDSFWRAVAYCLHPRVIALSFLPLVIMVGLFFVLGYFFWEPSIDWVRAMLESSQLMSSLLTWLEGLGLSRLKTIVAPLIVIFTLTPVIVVFVLVLVAALMAPAITAIVAERRFPQMERKHGGSFVRSILWSLGSTLLALVALVISLPLWLVPPLVLILPPLIWGWLTYRVMAYDALAEHATSDERRTVFRRHRPWLLGIGVIAGYMGAAPGLIWVSGVVMTAVFFVFLVPLAIWIYTLVFAFAALWFAHYCLAALDQLRRESAATPAPTPAPELAAPEPEVIHEQLPHT